jgi:hypothetical protein
VRITKFECRTWIPSIRHSSFASFVDKRVESQSKDDEVYFAVEATDAKGLDKTIEEAVEYLKEQGSPLISKRRSKLKPRLMEWTGLTLPGTASATEADVLRKPPPDFSSGGSV